MDPVSVPLSPFAMSSLQAEADRQGVSLEELVAHAAMYYLADLRCGRIAATVPEFVRVAAMPASVARA